MRNDWDLFVEQYDQFMCLKEDTSYGAFLLNRMRRVLQKRQEGDEHAFEEFVASGMLACNFYNDLKVPVSMD